MAFSQIVVDHQETFSNVVSNFLAPFGVWFEVGEQFFIASQSIRKVFLENLT
jgi:hypothetical protein